MLTIDDYWLTFLIGVVLPMLTALVTRAHASSALKAVVLLVLSVISGAATTIAADGGQFEWRSTLVGIVVTFVTAYGVHAGLLKNIGVTGAQGVIAQTVQGGLGTASSVPDGERANLTETPDEDDDPNRIA